MRRLGARMEHVKLDEPSLLPALEKLLVGSPAAAVVGLVGRVESSSASILILNSKSNLNAFVRKKVYYLRILENILMLTFH